MSGLDRNASAEPTEQLELRAAAGDAQASFALARALLSHPDADAQLARAIALLEGASVQGCADATELCALFDAMGVAREQSWDAAFDRLQLAAEQGSLTARRQLQVLAANRLPGGPADAAPGSWAELRAQISLDALVRHGPREALSDSPRIRVIKGFISPAEAQWLIERARNRLHRATVVGWSGEQGSVESRSNSAAEFLVSDMDVVMEVVRLRMSAATNLPLPVFEPTQVLHYRVGQAFHPHYDFFDPASAAYADQLRSGQRIATFLIYLNEEFTGGETDFPEVGIRYRGATGDAIFFANVDREGRPDRGTLHAGRAPLTGEKWLLSQWIRDRAPAA